LTIPTRFRRYIREMHLALDGWVGRNVYRQPSFECYPSKDYTPLTFSTFMDYQYSKRYHFEYFKILGRHQRQNPATCDLKVYQDSMVYTFILENLHLGARLLEIGGGESRIIESLKNKYEIWNLDKLEGVGFGPRRLVPQENYHLVEDYIGENSPELPNGYFDLIYSISTLEHLPLDEGNIQAVLSEINRLQRPGSYSLHCVDGLLYNDHYYIHPIVDIAYKNSLLPFPMVSFEQLINDNDLWLLSPFAFYTRWYPLVKQPLKKFGHPFSMNILWQKPG